MGLEFKQQAFQAEGTVSAKVRGSRGAHCLGKEAVAAGGEQGLRSARPWGRGVGEASQRRRQAVIQRLSGQERALSAGELWEF